MSLLDSCRGRQGRPSTTSFPALFALLALAPACSEATGDGAGGGPVAGNPNEILIDVPAEGRAFANLSRLEIVTPEDDGMSSTDWDLALSGFDVFTNSGSSGPGEGGAFPLVYEDYETGDVPGIPFLIEDEPGGAFFDWWMYDPAEHIIYSRFHVFGVRSGDRYWKVQLYGFYGDVQGAPVAALYSLRYAEVTSSGPGPTTEILDLDATAGGTDMPESAPSACLDLAGNETLMLTPAEAAKSTAWHLCFRRSVVSVNGELGGPGDVAAADLHMSESESETLEEIKTLTAASEKARFDNVDFGKLTDPAVPYRGDRILSAFSDKWLDLAADPVAPAKIAWLIQAAGGVGRWVAVFDRFESPTDTSVGRAALLVKKVE